MKSLADIYQDHKAPAGYGDKGTLHHYIENYEKLFAPYRDKKITLLEIGVCKGHSLRMWKEYFPKARIIGIDVVHPDPIPGCEFHICDQGDCSKLGEIFADTKFDIVIDDGTHLLVHQIGTKLCLDSKMNSDSLYVVEDIANLDYELPAFEAKFGLATIYDTRVESGRYDDVLLVWTKP